MLLAMFHRKSGRLTKTLGKLYSLCRQLNNNSTNRKETKKSTIKIVEANKFGLEINQNITKYRVMG